MLDSFAPPSMTHLRDQSLKVVAQLQATLGNTSIVKTLILFFTIMRGIFNFFNGLCYELYRERKLKSELEKKMQTATTFIEWKEIAQQVDILNGYDIWKNEKDSKFYDYELIETRLSHLIYLQVSKNPKQMSFALRAELHRNLGGIGNSNLYKCFVGTKETIEEYTQKVCSILDYICDSPSDGNEGELSLVEKFEFFRDTLHSFGRSALLLSGGASLGTYHFGVVKALYDCNLMPRIISGSSAGALIAALFCTRKDDEIPHVFEEGNLRLDPFQNLDQSRSIHRKLARLFKAGVLMDIRKLQECVRSNLGDVTFLEAYQKSGRILNITVSSSAKHTMPTLLNYLTSPHVLIWSAACASCALPGLFHPVELWAKDQSGNAVPYHPSGMKWSDGSVENDLPITRLSELFNVNHFIVSQTNPHVIPFMNETESPSLFNKIKIFLLGEIRYRILQLFEYNLLPQKLSFLNSVISQKYAGDITILPAVEITDYLKMLSNPTQDYIQNCIIKGQRRTWPKLSIIHNHCCIERKLDDCVKKLKKLMTREEGSDYKSRLKHVHSFATLTENHL